MDLVPTLVPILSAGQHRAPQHGGCFMEIASLLAGERWSDHPRCTHPVLAVVARAINDRTTDAGRPALAPLIPSVIGTNSYEPRIGPLLVACCARAALDAGAQQQRDELARSLHSAEQMVRSERHTRRAVRRYLRVTAPRAVNRAVSCLASASESVQDATLRALLVGAIADTRALCGLTLGVPAADLDRSSWAVACQLVGATELPRRD